MESSARTSVFSAVSCLPTPICSIQILEHSHLKKTCDVFSEGIGARMDVWNGACCDYSVFFPGRLVICGSILQLLFINLSTSLLHCFFFLVIYRHDVQQKNILKIIGAGLFSHGTKCSSHRPSNLKPPSQHLLCSGTTWLF